MKNKIPVAVLAATGSVGQRFVQLLDQHPWFDLACVTGSEKRIGATYRETCHWILPEPMPEGAANLEVVPTLPEAADVPLVFSALPKDIALDIEPLFARAGKAVCTNAGAFREGEDVPVLLPEVNADHIDLIPAQRKNRGWEGFIVTNPNCTSTGVTIALKALLDSFGVEKVFAVSLQAMSGAGYPGVPSMDIVDNVIPFINREEEKFEWEPRKMLGRLDRVVRYHAFDAHQPGRRNRRAPGLSEREIGKKRGAQGSGGSIQELSTTPDQPGSSLDSATCHRGVIAVAEAPDRPQPRLDRMSGKGMTTVVGRIRRDSIFDLKLLVLSHNTIRGAAGGSIYNAELLVKAGYIRN